MSIQFKELTLQNFWSFGKTPTTIDLSVKGLVRINGTNLDVNENGTASNGSGKTAIFLGIIYSLYGRGIDNVLSDGFINAINNKEMKVSFKFMKNDIEYIIERGRKPNSLIVYKDGVDITRDSVKNSNQLIEDIIGFPYEIFVNTYFLNTDSQSFMSMKPKEQQIFLEQILSLDRLTERADVLKDKRRDLKSNIEIESRVLEQVKNKNSTIYEQINKEKEKSSNFDIEKKKKLEDLKLELKNYEEIDLDREKKLIKRAEDIKEEISSLKENYYEKKEKYRTAAADMEKFDELVSTKAKISASFEDWKTNAETKKNRLKENIEKEPSLEDLDKQIEIIKKIDESIEKISKTDSEVEAKNREITNINKDLDKIDKDINSLMSGICPYCKQTYEDNKDKVQELTENKETLKNDIQSIEEKLSELNKFIEKETSYIENELYTSINKDIDLEYKDVVQKRDSLKQMIDQLNDLESDESPNPYESQYNEIVYEISKMDQSKLKETVEKCKAEMESENDKISEYEKELKDIESSKQGVNIQDVVVKKERLLNNIENTENQSNPHDESIKILETQIESLDSSKLENYEDELSHVDFLIKILTDPSGFIRRNLLETYIPFLNNRINNILQEIDLPHLVKIHSDLNVQIEYLGKETSYGNLSKGQKFRLNFATSIAFKELLTNTGKGIDWLGVDEYLDSNLDQNGVSNILDLIKEYSSTAFIITHKDNLENYFDKVINIEYKNGFSNVSNRSCG